MARLIPLGLGVALLALVLQGVLAQIFELLPAGTRAQGAGAAIATLSMFATGFVAGLLSRGPASIREAAAMLSPWRPGPWGLVNVSAAWLAVLALGWLGAGEFGFPASTWVEGGLARAALGADSMLFFGIALIGAGAVLGINTGRGTVLVALLGVLLLAGLSLGGGYLARFSSYDLQIIAAFSVAAVALAALLTGFLVSAVRQSLAFVELMLVALVSAYLLYFTVVLGPAGWVRGMNLPEEQIFLVLALFPAVAFGALLTVGGSLGFLFFGGGRFDLGFGAESKVALRYLKAHRRDGFVGIVTVIAVVGVCLGVMALIVVLSIMSGFEGDLKTKILGANAHAVVEKYGDDFEEVADVVREARATEGVASAAAFVLGDGMISTDSGLSGTVVKGVDVADSAGIGDLRRIVEKGRLEDLLTPDKIPGAAPLIPLSPPPARTATGSIAPPYELAVPVIRDPAAPKKALPGIVIGRELARTLRARVGDTVKMVSAASEEIGPLGPTPKLLRFRVAAIFYSGMYEYDAKFTYVEMKQAQRFFGMRGRVSGVEIKVKDLDETARIVEELKRRVGGYPFTVKDWRTMNKELFSALLLEKIAMFIALGMIVMVASFLIVAVLVMIVLQRKREIAILKSIGASDPAIMKMFVIQGLILGIGGAFLGGVLGVGICLLLEKYGYDLDPKTFYIERLPVVMDWGEIAGIAVAAVVITYLGTIYPAMTAALHRPVEGLRDE